MELKPIVQQDVTPDTINKDQLNIVNDDIKMKSALSLNKTPKVNQALSFSDKANTLRDTRFNFEEFNVKPDEVYAELSSGELVPKFDNFIKGTNNEERFAESQSTMNKWGNGLLKFGGKTLTAVAGGTLGTINGVAQWIQDGSFQSSYDNDFSDWLDDLNTKMDYKLPNYYTEQEKAQSFGQSLGSANFWANDVLGGLSFTVGTIVSEGIWAYATGGGSLATTAARTGLRAGKFFGEGAALTRALNGVAKIVKTPVIKAFARPNLPVELATKFGQAGQLANTLRFTYTSAGFEAGVEARHYMKEAKEQFYDTFQKQNGRLPNSEEIANFNENLTESGNALYGFNLALVGSSNLAVFGKFLGVKSPIKAPTKWANEMLFGVGMRRGAAGELEKITATKLQSAFAKAYSVGRVPVIEGIWEEGQQSVGKNTASNWVKSTYDPKYLGGTMDIGTAFVEGMGQTYGSKEGWKEIGIGMIIGLLSGTGMNLVQKRGLFAEATEMNKANDQEIQLRNDYTATKLLDRIHTANRIQSFTEAQDEAERVGDITGAELSRKSAIIAHVNNAYNYDLMDESLEEVTAGIRSMDSETLMKQYGLKTEDEVATLKESLINDYSETADSFSKHREFAEYFLNENSFSSMAEANRAREAVAYELTLGEHSHNYSRELLKEIQKEVAANYTTNGQSLSNALEVQDILWSSSFEVRRNYTRAQKSLQEAKLNRDNLEKERVSLERSQNSREDNTATLNRLNQVTIDVQQADQTIQGLTDELAGVLSAAQLQNPYNDESEPFLTTRDFENVETDLRQISKLVDEFSKVSPQRAARLEGLITEYSKSKTAFTRYADLARQLSDSTLGLRGKRNLLKEIALPKESAELTTEFLEGLRLSDSFTLADRAIEVVDNNSGVASVIRRGKAAMTAPVTESPTISTIEDIIKNNAYLLEYVGNEQKVVKPTDEEIAEYKALVEKIRADENIPDNQVTQVRPDYYRKAGNKAKVTPQELARFQELNQKMSDWRIFDGALNDFGISIADLINQDISKNQEITDPIIADELTSEDIVLVSTPTEAVPTRDGVEFRDSAIIQTYENVKVRIFGENYEFSHMNLSTILGRITTPYTVLMQTPSKVDENGYAIEWNKPVLVDVDEAIDNQKVGGTKFTVQMEQGKVPITVTNQSRLQIPLKTFTAIKGALGIDIFKQLTTRTTYSDAYVEDAEGNMVQMESDFVNEDNSGTVATTPDELYSLVYNENTFFKVNVNDAYNEKLKEDYEDGKITYENLVDLVKVYNVSGNNKVIGDLKSNQDIADADPVFLEIRKRAAEVLLKDQVAQSLVPIPFTAKVQHVILGTPNITMTKTEDGVVPQAQPLTQEALEAVTDFGYMQNGSLVLRNQTANVRTDFVDRLGRKTNIPVIVFQQGKFTVAYPVSLVKRAADRTADVAGILANRSLNNAQKATEINNYLIQNKISPKEAGLFYISETNQNMFAGDEISPELNAVLERLNNVADFVDVGTWLNDSYAKENLINDVEITIDLTNRPLRSPKVVINFNDAASTQSPLTWYEEWINTGNISEEKINEIASKLVAEATDMDGRNALTREENEIYVSENERIEKAIETIYKMTEQKQKEAAKEKRKSC